MDMAISGKNKDLGVAAQGEIEPKFEVREVLEVICNLKKKKKKHQGMTELWQGC